MRWEIPYYLLDALYFATDGTMMNTGNAKESKQMAIVLEKLQAAVKAGQADRSIQRVPHFVVLRKQFYTAHLQPLLAEWMLIWLGGKGVSGLTDHQVLEFLKKGPRDAVAARAVDSCTTLNSEHLKMLNLTHDWLTSFLPHILTKVRPASQHRTVHVAARVHSVMYSSCSSFPCNSVSPSLFLSFSSRCIASPSVCCHGLRSRN